MLTTPMVAEFQMLDASSSATETLKLARSRSFTLRSTWRLSLSDCAASMRRSRVRKAIMKRSLVAGRQQNHTRKRSGKRPTTKGQRRFLRHRFRSNFRSDKGFDHIAGLDVAVVSDGDAAFHAVRDFFGVVFEAAQRSDLAFEDFHVVA